jgi:assimilatory nitrate reductase catalytic subunit
MTRRVPALNAMSGSAIAELHPQTAARFKIADGSRLAVKTRRGSVDVTAKVTRDIRPDTIFMPFHWPDEQSANRLTNDALDPTSRMPEFKVCAARVDPVVKDSARPLGSQDLSPALRDLSKDTRS